MYLIDASLKSAKEKKAMIYDPQSIADYMANLGWKRNRDYAGGLHFGRPDGDYSVSVDDCGWTLGRFTDSDIDGVAVGRYQTIEDGETVLELMEALRGLPRQTPIGNAWVLQQTAPHFAAIGNGIYVRTGNRRAF
jgi:hypothetical protein